MKKQVTLLALVLCFVLPTFAHDFEVDGIYYNFLGGDSIEVTFKGNHSSEYEYEYAGSVTIPEKVEYNNSTYRITTIGFDAFSYCSSLTNIAIPNSVIAIGTSAFSFCSSLTNVTIPNSVTNIGNQAFYGCSSLTAPVYNTNVFAFMPSNYKGVYKIANNINSIAGGAFYNCSNLTAITIPNSVTTIGSQAFQDCSSLTNITIPNSVSTIGNSAFSGCSSLTNVTLHGNITTINENTFSYCSSLTDITIPNSVTNIGNEAFHGCSSLKYNIHNNAQYLGNSENLYHALIEATSTSITSCAIHENTKLIADGAFAFCSSLTNITIPESITIIGGWTFYQCSNLTAINIPNSVKAIGTQAFYNCYNLNDITIPNSVTSISNEAFYNCYNLNEVTLGKSVTTIGKCAFFNCYNFTNLNIPESVITIGNDAFYGCSSIKTILVETGNPNYHSVDNCLIDTHNTTLVRGCDNSVIPTNGSITVIGSGAFSHCHIDSINIPDCVTTIESLAFVDCQSLRTITIPIGITSIAGSIFDGCSSLSSISIPNGVTMIGEGAFRACSALTSITIPKNVINIGDMAFADCTNLTKINCLASLPPTISLHLGSVFYNIPSTTIITVPCGTSNLYKTATDWNILTNYQEDIFYNFSIISTNDTEGFVNILQEPTCNNDAMAIFEAVPAEGYTFEKWSDGNTENPRTVEVTQDTTFTALFAPAITDLSLRTHSIMLYPKDSYYMNAIVVPEDADKRSLVWSSSNEAIVSVEGCIATAHQIGKAIVKVTTADGLLSDSCEVVVSEEGHEAKDDVVVDPDNESVDITWTPVEGAAYYVFVVYADEAQVTKICTLTFDAWGHLINIHFMPKKPASNVGDNPFNFTVTGLEAETTYAYSMSSYDEEETLITHITGEFTTTSSATTGVETLYDNVSTEPRKVLENGVLYIVRDGVKYTIDGRKVVRF